MKKRLLLTSKTLKYMGNIKTSVSDNPPTDNEEFKKWYDGIEGSVRLTGHLYWLKDVHRELVGIMNKLPTLNTNIERAYNYGNTDESKALYDEYKSFYDKFSGDGKTFAEQLDKILDMAESLEKAAYPPYEKYGERYEELSEPNPFD